MREGGRVYNTDDEYYVRFKKFSYLLLEESYHFANNIIDQRLIIIFIIISIKLENISVAIDKNFT